MDQRGVAYIRVSKVGDRGDDLLSPELQEHSIRVFAEREGIEIVDVVPDIDKSGRSFARRRVGQIIEDIKAGRYKYVLLWKWSRWGRNMRQSQLFLGMVEDAGGVVRASTEDYDTSTSIGKFTRDQMLLIAQLQSDQISDGWKEVQERRRRLGLPTSGRPRFGYKSAKDAYLIDPITAPYLKDAYERYVGGVGHRQIAREWNAADILTTRGNRWTPVSLGAMMDTGFAAGLIRERTKPPSAEKNSRDRASFDVWRIGSHEPIIDLPTWKAYEARRDSMRALAPRLRAPQYAFSGVLRCGVCGYSMNSRKRRAKEGGALWWNCKYGADTKSHPANWISDAEVEAAVLDWLGKNLAVDSDDVTAEARRLEANQEARTDGDKWEAEVRRLLSKRERLVELYEDGDIEREEYRERRATLDMDLRAAEQERDVARARQHVSGDDMIRRFGHIAEEWPRFTNAGKREIMRQIARPVRIYREAPRVRIRAVWEEGE